MNYDMTARVFFIGALCSGIVAGIGLIMFWRLIKKSGHKRVEEIEPQLNRLLRLTAIGAALTGILGGIGGILRLFI